MTLALDDIPQADEATGHPQGRSERWTRDDILLLAAILLADVDAVAAAWNSLAGTTWRGLMLAVAIDDVRAVEPDTLPPLWFDVFSQRYGIGRRGWITDAAMFAVLEQVKMRVAGQRASEIAAVYSGTVAIGDWQAALVPTLKTLILMARALGRGGVGRLTGDDLKQAAADLAFHLTRLERFARVIESGTVTQDAAERRAAAYPVSTITGGFDGARVESHRAAGFVLQRNILDPVADHCETRNGVTGCPEITAMGWRPLGTLPDIGHRPCLWQCRCHWEFSREQQE